MSKKPLRLPQADFEKSFELVPRIALNLLIKNQAGEILLTKRNIKPFRNHWHFPGTFLLKNETISGCLKRLAKQEVGFELKQSTVKFLGVFEDIEGDPRGHVIDVMYEYHLDHLGDKEFTQETKELRFFKKLPQQVGFNHRDTLKQLGFK